MDQLSFECCFCGAGADTDLDVSRGFDPCAVPVIGNWRAPESQQLSQQFFCHLQCLKGKMAKLPFIDIEDMRHAPYFYLKGVMERVPTLRVGRIEELLPHRRNAA
jgi:hypothetical protein